MNIFHHRKKFVVSERNPTFQVRYLGNVLTQTMKEEGCADKPASLLWNNHLSTGSYGLSMEITITSCGLKAVTKEQGVTEYRAHRITYCQAHPNYPCVFLWICRHEGKKHKVELRCHAVFCKSHKTAIEMELRMNEKLKFSLAEYVREKTRRQTSRMTRANSLPSKSNKSDVPLRRQLLSKGHDFKLPVERSHSASKLGSIDENLEELVDENLEELEEFDSVASTATLQPPSDIKKRRPSWDDTSIPVSYHTTQRKDSDNNIVNHTNYIDDFYFDKHTEPSDSDDDISTESGFSEQDQDNLCDEDHVFSYSPVPPSTPSNSDVHILTTGLSSLLKEKTCDNNDDEIVCMSIL